MLKTIRFELARSPGAPGGDTGHAYILRAPIDDNGYLDQSGWEKVKTLCTVKKLAKGNEVESGLLILTKSGTWAFSYAVGDEDDENVFKLGHHRFQAGEYLSVTEHDGIQRTFKITAVTDWHPESPPSGKPSQH